jgi:hypothetical protein
MRLGFRLGAKPGNGTENSKNVQQPQNHGNNYHDIQDLFDGTCHWNVVIHQPKENANHDQNQHYINYRHDKPHLGV